MALVSYNLNVRFTQGNTPFLDFTIYDSAGNLFNTGTVIAAHWVVKASATSSPILLQKTLVSGISFPAYGICRIAIAAVDTVTPPLTGCNVHQLVLTDNTGNVLTVTGKDDEVGRFVVDPRIAAAP